MTPGVDALPRLTAWLNGASLVDVCKLAAMVWKRSPWSVTLRPAKGLLVQCYIFYIVLVMYCASDVHVDACPADGNSSPATLILCRSCGHELAYGTDIRFYPSRLALNSRNDTWVGGRRVNIQLFENPHGHQFEVITFRRADLTLLWPADNRFSWFPGFSWTMATCPRCNTHLGGYRTTAVTQLRRKRLF